MPDLDHDPVRRQYLSFGGDSSVLQLEAFFDPGGNVPAHVHPNQEERFEVLAGTVRFVVDGQRIDCGPGDRVVAARGSKHSFENVGLERAHLRVEAEPALQLREFLQRAAALARDGLYTRRGIPTRPRAIVELADLMVTYADTTVLSFPPPLIQKWAIAPFARLKPNMSASQRGPAA